MRNAIWDERTSRIYTLNDVDTYIYGIHIIRFLSLTLLFFSSITDTKMDGSNRRIAKWHSDLKVEEGRAFRSRR